MPITSRTARARQVPAPPASPLQGEEALAVLVALVHQHQRTVATRVQQAPAGSAAPLPHPVPVLPEATCPPTHKPNKSSSPTTS